MKLAWLPLRSLDTVSKKRAIATEADQLLQSPGAKYRCGAHISIYMSEFVTKFRRYNAGMGNIYLVLDGGSREYSELADDVAV